MRLYIISNNSTVNTRLENEWGTDHELLFQETPGKDFAEYDAILVVEPYVINGEYLSIADIWHTYLVQHFPETKLLTVGFAQDVDDLNFLSLLEVGPSFDLRAFIELALPVNKQANVYHVGNGYDKVSEKLKLFFRGHSQEGIIDSISKLRQVLNNAELSLHGNKKLKHKRLPFKVIWLEKLWAHKKKVAFQQFYNRWYNYKSYFHPLPLQLELEEFKVEDFIEKLHYIFSQKRKMDSEQLVALEQKYRELDPFRGVGDIVRLFRKLNSKYITPEYAGHILLVDDDEDFHQQMKMGLPQFTFSSMLGEEELKMLIQQNEVNYDLILLDLGLDNTDQLVGIDWIPKLRKKFPTIPLIVVTVYDTQDTMVTTIEEGANFFLAKSLIDSEKWTTVLMNLIAGRRYTYPEIVLFNKETTWEDKPSILVIEDEKDWFTRMTQLSESYHWRRANTFDQAKDVLNTEKIDLTLLDLYFRPEGPSVQQGLDFIKSLYDQYPEIPIVVIAENPTLVTRREIEHSTVRKILFRSEFDTLKWLEVIQILTEYKRNQERLHTL
ncbi:MAG: response regulator [Bacteroidota bacterium]